LEIELEINRLSRGVIGKFCAISFEPLKLRVHGFMIQYLLLQVQSILHLDLDFLNPSWRQWRIWQDERGVKA